MRRAVLSIVCALTIPLAVAQPVSEQEPADQDRVAALEERIAALEAQLAAAAAKTPMAPDAFVADEPGWKNTTTPRGWSNPSHDFQPDQVGSGADERDSSNEIVARESMEYMTQVSRAPAGRAALGLPAPDGDIEPAQLDITFDKDGGTAAVALSRVRQVVVRDGYARKQSWTLTLFAPIDGDTGVSRLATTAGLSAGFGAKLERRWQRQALGSLETRAFGDALAELCGENHPGISCNFAQLRQEAATSTEAVQRLQMFNRRHLPRIVDFGISLEAARTRTDYFTPQLDARQQRAVGWGLSATFGVIPRSRTSAYVVGATFGRAYEAADEAIFCPPSNGTDPVQCVSGSLGPPTQRDRQELSFEARGAFLRAGYSLLLTHDIGTGESKADLPVYFLRDAKDALMGGLRFGWSSDAGSDVAVFVSAPFSF